MLNAIAWSVAVPLAIFLVVSWNSPNVLRVVGVRVLGRADALDAFTQTQSYRVWHWADLVGIEPAWSKKEALEVAK
jgi:hypothetical protein